MRSASPAISVAVCLLLALTVAGQEPSPDRRDPGSPARIPAVVFIPTPHDVVDEMLRMARVTKDDVLYDLGCGDGRIVAAAAKRYGCRAVGCDIDPLRVEEAREKVKESGLEHLVTIKRQDLFEIDLSEATVVTLYLTSRYNEKLLPQLRKMKPGGRIVSHEFGFLSVKAEKAAKIESREDEHTHRVYLWTTPLAERRPGRVN